MFGSVVLFLVTVVRCSVLFVMLHTCVVACCLSRCNTTKMPHWSGAENAISNRITKKPLTSDKRHKPNLTCGVEFDTEDGVGLDVGPRGNVVNVL